MRFESITFFRPDEVKRKPATLPAEVFNHTRLLLGRSHADCQFVPIRSMQYQGVITDNEIIFVDAQGYAVRDGEGGRIIVMAWQLDSAKSRDSLTKPVDIEVVHYHHDMDELERRLFGEFDAAMSLMLERQLGADLPGQEIKVVSIPVKS